MDGKLYAVSTLDGTEMWTYTTGGAIEGAPAISAYGQTIFVGSATKAARNLDPQYTGLLEEGLALRTLQRCAIAKTRP